MELLEKERPELFIGQDPSALEEEEKKIGIRSKGTSIGKIHHGPS